MNTFKLAICQIHVTKDKQQNLDTAREYIGTAANQGAAMIVLPEMFNCPLSHKYFASFAETLPNGPTAIMLSELAKKHNIYIAGGSIPEKDGNNIYNTSPVFAPDGNLIAKHRKLHLFDADLAGGQSFQESKTIAPGQHITVFDTKLCRIGLCICYDVRFPELFRIMTLNGAELIIIPAAFNMTTGPVHWQMILQTRAVDNQVYIAGSAPSRVETGGYVSYGHSMIIDPWGEVLADAGTGENIIYAKINLQRIKTIRQQLPLLKHRRTDLYFLKEYSDK